MKGGALTVVNNTNGKQIRLPFVQMKQAVLGKRYILDVIFITPKESSRLNALYRKKNKPANVLSFPLSQTVGQIVLCPRQAQLEAKTYRRTPTNFIGFLFIHGLLHLKGYRHGSRMEAEEKRLSAKFLAS